MSGTHDLWKHVPPITRARGYRLYDNRGRRLLDLYQAGGAALIGHRGSSLTGAIKTVASRGLLLDLPSIYGLRLLKALSRRYPGYGEVHIVSSMSAALDLISSAMGRHISAREIADPALGQTGDVCLDRPFLTPSPAGGPSALVLIPVLPFRIGGGPIVLCLKQPLPASRSPHGHTPLSPLLLSGALRALHDLEHFEPPEWYHRPLVKPLHGWIQRGPYLQSLVHRDRYPALFLRFLESDVLLSPDPESPSILPGDASQGELDKLAKLLQNVPKGHLNGIQ